MLHKKFTRSPTMKENDNGRRHFHRDGRKIKNKIKFLFKLKQYETWSCVLFRYIGSSNRNQL